MGKTKKFLLSLALIGSVVTVSVAGVTTGLKITSKKNSATTTSQLLKPKKILPTIKSKQSSGVKSTIKQPNVNSNAANTPQGTVTKETKKVQPKTESEPKPNVESKSEVKTEQIKDSKEKKEKLNSQDSQSNQSISSTPESNQSKAESTPAPKQVPNTAPAPVPVPAPAPSKPTVEKQQQQQQQQQQTPKQPQITQNTSTENVTVQPQSSNKEIVSEFSKNEKDFANGFSTLFVEKYRFEFGHRYDGVSSSLITNNFANRYEYDRLSHKTVSNLPNNLVDFDINVEKMAGAIFSDDFVSDVGVQNLNDGIHALNYGDLSKKIPSILRHTLRFKKWTSYNSNEAYDYSLSKDDFLKYFKLVDFNYSRRVDNGLFKYVPFTYNIATNSENQFSYADEFPNNAYVNFNIKINKDYGKLNVSGLNELTRSNIIYGINLANLIELDNSDNKLSPNGENVKSSTNPVKFKFNDYVLKVAYDLSIISSLFEKADKEIKDRQANWEEQDDSDWDLVDKLINFKDEIKKLNKQATDYQKEFDSIMKKEENKAYTTSSNSGIYENYKKYVDKYHVDLNDPLNFKRDWELITYAFNNLTLKVKYTNNDGSTVQETEIWTPKDGFKTINGSNITLQSVSYTPNIKKANGNEVVVVRKAIAFLKQYKPETK